MASTVRTSRSRVGARHLAGAVLAALGLAAAILPGVASSGVAGRSAGATTIDVTLGKPFKVVPKTAAGGTVVFTVRNTAKIPYRFAVCVKPTPATPAAKVTACAFKTTPLLKPGKTSTLRLSLATKGSYRYFEYTTPPTNEFRKPPKTEGAGMSGAIAVSGPAAAGGNAGQGGGSKGGGGAQSSALAAGATIFKSKCGACHALAAAKTRGGIGPDLDQLKPSKAVVARQVRSGGGQMPSFAAVLTAAQINDVAAYVYSSTH